MKAKNGSNLKQGEMENTATRPTLFNYSKGIEKNSLGAYLLDKACSLIIYLEHKTIIKLRILKIR